MKACLWRDVLFFGRTGGLFNSFALRLLFEHRPVEDVVIASKGYPVVNTQIVPIVTPIHDKNILTAQKVIISVDLDTLNMVQLRGVHFISLIFKLFFSIILRNKYFFK